MTRINRRTAILGASCLAASGCRYINEQSGNYSLSTTHGKLLSGFFRAANVIADSQILPPLSGMALSARTSLLSARSVAFEGEEAFSGKPYKARGTLPYYAGDQQHPHCHIWMDDKGIIQGQWLDGISTNGRFLDSKFKHFDHLRPIAWKPPQRCTLATLAIRQRPVEFFRNAGINRNVSPGRFDHGATSNYVVSPSLSPDIVISFSDRGRDAKEHVWRTVLDMNAMHPGRFSVNAGLWIETEVNGRFRLAEYHENPQDKTERTRYSYPERVKPQFFFEGQADECKLFEVKFYKGFHTDLLPDVRFDDEY